MSSGSVDSGAIAAAISSNWSNGRGPEDRQHAGELFRRAHGRHLVDAGRVAASASSQPPASATNGARAITLEQSPGNFDLSRDRQGLPPRRHREPARWRNGLIGLGYEFGDGNKLRWTNLYIHDTLKRTSLAEGQQNNQRPGADYQRAERPAGTSASSSARS